LGGNGREWGDYGFVECLETKAVLGFRPKKAVEQRPFLLPRTGGAAIAALRSGVITQ
jgi:hypothetical protein